MKKKQKLKIKNYFLLVILLLCLLMIGSTCAMIASFSKIIEDEAKTSAAQFVKTTSGDVINGLNSYKVKASALGSDITARSYKNKEEFDVTFHSRSLDSIRYGDIKFVRYFKDGVEYSSDGLEFDMDIEAPEVKKAVEDDVLTCVGVIDDNHFSLSVACYFVPLPDDFEYADSIVVFYPVTPVVTSSLTRDRDDYKLSLFHVVTSSVGNILDTLYATEEFDDPYGNVFNILRDEINDKNIIDRVEKNVLEGTSGVYSCKVGGNKCIVSVTGIHDNDNASFAVVGYYRADVVNSSDYVVVNAVMGEFLIFFICVLGVVIFVIIHTIRTRSKIASINEINLELGCPTRYKFELVAQEIINRNKGTNFAVISVEIKHYQYVVEQIGRPQMIQILKRLLVIFSKNLALDETYGYAGHGRFLLLLHYRELEDVEKRLSTIVAIASQHQSQLSGNVQVVLSGGIYTTNRKLTESTEKMVDLANEAEKATKYPYDFSVFRLYNELLHSSSIQNEFIEVHMDKALENHDFKVFYQAKHNILENRVDGAEALVRWFNPDLNEYMQPGVFLPLFEANRFIIKLDHYIMEQVCLYIEDAKEHGLPLYPISVNASRITASDKDFVEFYVNMKNAHNIDDGFLTIEFTESFAYEDYDMLREIVARLHQNGFKCSIDDFGSGFSSYSILKELPMDEIKLDGFFIKEGFSRERDLKVLSSIIKLGRELHMKVTQEGVENEEEIKLLKGLGCQVVQGYYYSKPLSLTEYIKYLQEHERIEAQTQAQTFPQKRVQEPPKTENVESSEYVETTAAAD